MSPSTPARRAFTLLELMLVLAVVAMIGAMALPALTNLFERQTLQGAADKLRIGWQEAQLNAMRTGQAQVFNCVPGTRDYSLQPLISQSDATNAGAGATLLTATGTLVETQANIGGQSLQAASGPSQLQLDEKLTFVGCVVSSDMRAYAIAQNPQATGGQINVDNVAQSVIFYPDGTTSTAEVRMRNERGDVRAIQMRGLTGYVRVIELPNVASEAGGK